MFSLYFNYFYSKLKRLHLLLALLYLNFTTQLLSNSTLTCKPNLIQLVGVGVDFIFPRKKKGRKKPYMSELC